MQIVDGRDVRIVRLDDLDAGGEPDAVRFERSLTIGAWADGRPSRQTLGVGLRRSRRVEVPADCRLVVVVPDEAMLKRLQELGLLKKGDHTCAVTEPPQR